MLAIRSQRFIRSLTGSVRNFSSSSPVTNNSKDVPSKTRVKNMITAGLIFSFVGGVYWYSLSKMKVDEFEKLVEADKESK